jgi:hypothetical protein
VSYTTELIDRYKIAIGVDSDYAVAKALGLRANRISNYRTGISHADDKTAVMLATVLHIDPLETIARINMDRATERTDKDFWRKLAGVAALLFVTVVLPLPAAAWAPEPLNADSTMHYAKLKGLARFLSRQLRTILLGQKPLEVRHGSPALLAA